MRTAYQKLKTESEDAAYVLVFAVGNGLDKNPGAGEARILNCDSQTFAYVRAVAQKISTFDNELRDGLGEELGATPVSAGADGFGLL